MPPFISDPPQFVYLVLGAVLVITAAIAAQRQDRKSALPFFIALAVAIAVFVIDRLVDSPREEAVKHSMAMIAAADAKNPDAFVEHLTDPIVYKTADGGPKTVKRDDVKKSPFWGLLRQHNVRVAAKDFSRDNVKVIDDDTIEIGFMARGESGSQHIPVYVRATYKRQSDGKMKLIEFGTYHPVNHNETFPIPGFP